MDMVQKAALVPLDETQDTIILNVPVYTVGRAQNNTHVLRDIAVSRCHCVFKYTDAGWLFTDLSSNGCGINHDPAVLHTNPLKSDDLIYLTDLLKYKFFYPYTPNKKRKLDENTNVMCSTTNNAECSKDIATLRDQLKEENKSKIQLEEENKNLKDSLLELKSLMTNVDKMNINLQGQILELQARYDTVVIEREAVQKQLDALRNQAELFDSKLQSAATSGEINPTQEADRTLMICALKVEIIDKEESIKDKFKKIIESTSATLEDTSRQRVQTILNELQVDIEQLSLKRKELTIFTTSNSSKLTVTNIAEDLAKLLESDMLCSICNEHFVQATAINCGHMFCKGCITKWSRRKKTCPFCREPFTVISSCKAVDNLLDQIIETWLPDKMELRNTLKTSYSAEIPAEPRTSRSPNVLELDVNDGDISSSVSVESISSESEEDSVVSVDSIYNPMRGRGRLDQCFNCGEFGHRPNACPFRYGSRY